jgi:phage terminase small subunit
MPKRIPRTPTGLGSAGKELWKAILGDTADDWELDRRELHLLERACVCADRLAELDAAVKRDGTTTAGSRGQTVVHPALGEARQLELVQMRLLSSIELADPAEATSPARQRAQRAAAERWNRKVRTQAQRRRQANG